MRPSFDFLERTSSETGYQSSPLEKVILLGEFAGDIARHPFLGEVLVLKGGTALNLCFGEPGRLSVDLDFNYIGHVEREMMLEDRPRVEKAVTELARRQGYLVQNSADAFAGRKLYLSYTSVLGQTDRIEVDMNYLFRLPIAKPEIREMWQPGGLDRPSIRAVSLSKLIVGKLLAFLDRGAVRDAWDIGRLPEIAGDELKSPVFRARFIAMSAILDQPLTSYPLSRIKDRLTEISIAQELTPLLTFDTTSHARAMVERAWQVVSPLLSLRKNERDYVAAISGGDLNLSLLFSQDKQEAKRLAGHPALLWKMTNVQRMLQQRNNGSKKAGEQAL